MTKTNKYLLPALAVVMILSLVAVIVLMLRPLYENPFVARADVMYIYNLTIDGEETQYHSLDWVSPGSVVIPFIKGKQIEGADPNGNLGVYRWRLEPKSSTEYLLLESVAGGITIVKRSDE